MKVLTKDNIEITCTPEEFIQLQKAGVFGSGTASNGRILDLEPVQRPQLDPKDRERKWPFGDVVMVYGCQIAGTGDAPPKWSGTASDSLNDILSNGSNTSTQIKISGFNDNTQASVHLPPTEKEPNVDEKD